MGRETKMGVPMRLPENALIQTPSGAWSFVGRVDARLAYVTKDGFQPSERQMSDARSFGPGLIGLKTRVVPTRAAAEMALADLADAPGCAS
jgi:hypothetical protein